MQHQIQHQHGHNHGSFFIAENGVRVAELNYRMDGGAALLLHTFVDPSLRGGGVGMLLIEAAVDWARRENKKLVPVCSYAHWAFSRRPDFSGVLEK
ncbi:MAG: putative protein YjdJ [Myxococcota bacterium]|nr:putative protein YjdJ [Myxococcota bacterium]